MAMVVQHNMQAINANRMLGITTSQQSKSTEKLSSGYRINRAADDAAGLSISEKMRSQIRGLNKASSNAQDGISLIQTAEGALNETHSILQRMRELSVQAANGTETDDDREAIQSEITQLQEEVTRISETTQFNTMNLLDGSLGSKSASSQGTTLTGSNIATFKAGSMTTANIKAMDLSALAAGGSAIDTFEIDGESFEIDWSKGDAKKFLSKYGVDYGTTAMSSAQTKSFAEDLQNLLNDAASEQGVKGTVTVKYNADGQVKITSDNTGEDSSFGFVGSTGTTTASVGTVTATTIGGASTEQIKVTSTVKSGVYTYSSSKWFDSTGASATGISFIGTAPALNNGDTITVASPVTSGSSFGAILAGTATDNSSKLADAEMKFGNTVASGSEFTMTINGTEVKASITGGDIAEGTGLTTATSGVAARVQTAVQSAVSAYNTAMGYSAGNEEFLKAVDFTVTANKDGSLSVNYSGDVKDVTFSFSEYTKGGDTSTTATKLGLINKQSASATQNKGMKLQIGANEGQTMEFTIDDMSAAALGVDGSKVNLSTQADAEKSITTIDAAIKKVSAQRSSLGAVQNRLEHTVSNLDNIAENTTSAESAIRDTDMAEEMVNYSKNNILAQAGQSMLAQANQSNQGVLSILG